MGLFEEYLFKLASDDLKGRAPGINGGLMTKNYISDQYKDMGLNMLGDSYLMPVKLAEVTLNTSTSNFNLTYQGEKIDLIPDKQYVYWTKRQVDEVQLKPSDLIFVGYGVNAPEYDWLDYSDIDVTGKTLVLLINDPGFELKDPNLFKGKAMTYYGRWGYKYEEAARWGASGVLLFHVSAPAASDGRLLKIATQGLHLWFQ
jgi:Predicted aminopeptidases